MHIVVLNVFFIFKIGSLSFVSKFLIDGMCVVVLAPATSIMNGVAFLAFVMMLLMRGWYFVVFLSRISHDKFIITICKFYELYGDFWWRDFRWEIYTPPYILREGGGGGGGCLYVRCNSHKLYVCCRLRIEVL